MYGSTQSKSLVYLQTGQSIFDQEEMYKCTFGIFLQLKLVLERQQNITIQVIKTPPAPDTLDLAHALPCQVRLYNVN